MPVSNNAISSVESFVEPYKFDVEAAKKGNQNAMHRLYTAYAKAMLNTAYRILNNREDAEDVLQESFVKAFSRLEQFNFQSTFGAWVKRIVVNASIDTLKKRKRNVFLLNEGFELPDEAIVFQMYSPVEQDKRLDLLYKALHQLPDGYRTVFSLYLLEGYDHSEIAAILNIEVSTSISQLSRAKKKLKSLIKLIS